MSYVELPQEDDLTGAGAEVVAAERRRLGYVPTYARLYALRPEVEAAWKQLAGAIRAGMGERRYELATLGAARGLRSTYCAVAHGGVLAERLVGVPGVRRLLDGEVGDGVTAVDLAVVAFAEKVGRAGADVRPEDVEALRDVGLDDDEIVDVVLAVAARCFFSTTLDALGLQADAAYRETVLDEIRDDLVVGRPIAEA